METVMRMLNISVFWK